MTVELKNLKKELLFYYESRQNPNGDPGFENQPRLMPDGTILVTDVRVKRTIRDYAKNKFNETLFVDYGEDGTPVTADKRAKEIVKKGEIITGLLKETFDTPLFGALVTIRSKGSGKEEGSARKITGPVQFGIGRSVNQVQILNPMITGRFVGKAKKEGEEQFSTFGKFYAVEYALIKIQGVVNPVNLGQYLEDKEIMKKYTDAESKLFECLWNGTNSLVSRSKFPQRSIFFLEVSYDEAMYNDLPLLVEEDPTVKGKISALPNSPLKFEKLLEALKARRKLVVNVRVAACHELHPDVDGLVAKLQKENMSAELIRPEEIRP
jgi:CRISPR-associated protein Csh2